MYKNVTNVVVRVSHALKTDAGTVSNTDHAVLISAHYDSALGTAAASDDVANIANMVEILRALSHSPPLKHAVIFNFNGAEETVRIKISHVLGCCIIVTSTAFDNNVMVCMLCHFMALLCVVCYRYCKRLMASSRNTNGARPSKHSSTLRELVEVVKCCCITTVVSQPPD